MEQCFSASRTTGHLSVPLQGIQARFLRLALSGTSYFHLDEVEVFAAGSTNNLALGKPATQSSVSQWSVAHVRPARGPRPITRSRSWSSAD